MRLFACTALSLLLASPAWSQSSAPTWGSYGIDTDSADHTVKPGDDFWSYVNGSWAKTVEIPADRGALSQVQRLNDLAAAQVRAILDEMQARRSALSAEERRAVMLFNRIIERVDDGHVTLSWPRPAPPTASMQSAASRQPAATKPSAASFCRARGYQSGTGGPGIGPSLASYKALSSGDVLPAGTVEVDGTRAGIIRIGVFDPHGSLSLCEEAVAALSIPLDRPCDSACEDAIITRAYRSLTTALDERLSSLRGAGAKVMIIDITGNGGGSEWAEVAARMLSSRPLTSARIGFVRGAHWERLWREQAERLRGFASSASEEDRARLRAWAAEAEKARAEAARRCPPTGDASCPWLGRAGYATGLVGRVKAGEFTNKDWGVHIFNPGQHPYRDAVWDGPVIVLTDEETWSAAEQFAAVLQDNQAALIVGGRTGGAGCGHTWGGTPTRLTNSGAVLNLPDCVRFRADGSNEVRGIMPDLPINWRANDGRALRARLLEAALPKAIPTALGFTHRVPPFRVQHRDGSVFGPGRVIQCPYTRHQAGVQASSCE